jgi:hypothetical protein
MDGIDRARSQAVTSPLPSRINGLIGNFLMQEWHFQSI